MRTVLVVDVGTSSVRTVLAGEDMSILAMIQEKRAAGNCMDAEKEWNCIRRMIKCLINQNRELLCDNPVSAAAVSALVGWVGVDSRGNALTPCYTYMHREQRTYEGMMKALPAEQEMVRICGRAPAPEWMAYKLLRIKQEEPELYSRIAAMTSLKDYINSKLCGKLALDHTTAGYTFLYDITKGRWDSRLINCFGIDPQKLPVLIRPWEKLGTVRRELAREFSLEGEIPVAVGSCDGSTAILGAGGVREKTAVSVMGTTDVLFLVAKNWNVEENCGLIINPHVIPGYWLIGGPMGMYGGTVEWLRTSIAGAGELDELNRLAAGIEPGCGGLTVLPNLAGERTPYWNAACAGTMAGLTAAHRTEHIFRGIMEANGFDCREILERAGRMGAGCSGMIAIGGGASNDLWLSIKAAITGLPVWRNAVTEATVAGSAMLALIMQDGAGAVRTPERTQLFEGTERLREKYDRLYLQYRERRRRAEYLYK